MESENENEEEYVEVEFPLEYPECAVCGCKDTIAQTIVNGLIAEGKASEKLRAGVHAAKIVIADPTRAWLATPMLAVVMCACVQCGTVRVTSAATRMVMAGTEPHQVGPQNMQ